MHAGVREVEITRLLDQEFLIRGVPVRVTRIHGPRVTVAVPEGVEIAKPEDLELSELIDGWGEEHG